MWVMVYLFVICVFACIWVVCRYTPLLDRLEARKKERERVKANLDACLRMETEVRTSPQAVVRGGSSTLEAYRHEGRKGGGRPVAT